MAKIVNTYTNDEGHIINVYESGAEYNTATSRLVKASPKTQITSENATSYIRKRQEKTARLLREQIVKAHNAIMPTSAHNSPEAIALSGAMLYEEIVLNSDAYPRDRLETWREIGKYAEVLPSDLRKVHQEDVDAVRDGIAQGVSEALERIARDVLARDVVDVKVIE